MWDLLVGAPLRAAVLLSQHALHTAVAAAAAGLDLRPMLWGVQGGEEEGAVAVLNPSVQEWLEAPSWSPQLRP